MEKNIVKKVAKKKIVKKTTIKKTTVKKINKKCLLCNKLTPNSLCIRCSNKSRQIQSAISEYNMAKVKKCHTRPCDGCGDESECTCITCHQCYTVMTKLFDGTQQKCSCQKTI